MRLWRRRRLNHRILLVGFLLLIVVVSVVVYDRQRNPSHALTLQRVLIRLQGDSQGNLDPRVLSDAVVQIQAAGEESLPELISELQFEIAPQKKRVTRMSSIRWNLRDVLRFILEPFYTRTYITLETPNLRQLAAIRAIQALGTNAVPALPELQNLMATPRMAIPVLAASSRMGVASLPLQKIGLASEVPQVRVLAINNLLLLGTNAAPALPALLTLLGDGSSSVRHASLRLIQEIDREDWLEKVDVEGLLTNEFSGIHFEVFQMVAQEQAWDRLPTEFLDSAITMLPQWASRIAEEKVRREPMGR